MGYNNYYLYGIILDGCPYSMAAKELLEENITDFYSIFGWIY